MQDIPLSGDAINAPGSQGFINKPLGPVWQTFITSPNQVIPLPTQSPSPPELFVGRQAELRQLDEWLGEVTPDFMRNEGHPAGKMVLIYGPDGMGKSSLLRRWLADVHMAQQPPIIVHIGFDLRPLVGRRQERTDWGQAIYGLNWQALATSLGQVPSAEPTTAAYFPSAFRLGSCTWVSLAAQLTLQSQHIQQTLASGADWTVDLRYDDPLPPAEALTELLKLAAQQGRPIILVCEGLQQASNEWFTLLQSWEKEIRRMKWPVLLLLEYAYPQPLTAPPLEAQSDGRLSWLRQSCGAPNFRAEAIYLAPLTRNEIETILLPDSQQFASDLFILSEGNPTILRQLLAWWRTQGVATEPLAGHWQIRRLPTDTYLFKGDEPLRATIDKSLQHSAALAADLGYDLSAETLLVWLNHAVWEGDTFHDQALALAVGWHGDYLDDFLTILDEALCRSAENPHGLLEELDEIISLPIGDNQTRHLARYRFVPSILAVLLRQSQDHQGRLHYGQVYAQALAKVYAPHHERILERLAEIYQSLGLARVAASYRQQWAQIAYLEQEEAALQSMRPLATTDLDKRLLMNRILRFFNAAYRRRHPGQLLHWLAEALSLSRQLRDQRSEAATLHNIGSVYSALGEKEKALGYYAEALPLRRQVGDKRSEAYTLTNIGSVYSDLGEQEKALGYYAEALPLRRQVGDKGGEAATLHCFGLVYSDLGEKEKALGYYAEALPLRRQVDDRWNECVTLWRIARTYEDLGDLAQAEAHFEAAVQVAEAVKHPDLEDFRAGLERVRRVRAGVG